MRAYHQSGQADLYIDGNVVVKNSENQTAGELFFHTGTVEEKGKTTLEKGKEYKLTLEWSNFKPIVKNGRCNAWLQHVSACRSPI